MEQEYRKLKAGQNISARFQDALDSEDIFMVKDPNNPDGPSIPFEISLHGDDTKVVMKKGLKHQIELLRQLPFNKEEQRQFALSLKGAIAKAKEGMKGM